MTDNDFVTSLLRLVAKYDVADYLGWDESLKFFVNCNDLFFWGCCDSEPIAAESLPELELALQDAGDDGMFLYVARRRKMRPQGALYEHIEPGSWPLFDACGPERPKDFGNPVATP